MFRYDLTNDAIARSLHQLTENSRGLKNWSLGRKMFNLQTTTQSASAARG